MGAATSRISEKISSRSKSIPAEKTPERTDGGKGTKTENDRTSIPKTGDYLVRARRGSMYYDEDGDLAHEFYVEVAAKEPGKEGTMRRVFDNLTPEGDVFYATARLSPDYPLVVSDL